MRTFSVPDGMPRSIFENKYSRRKEDGSFQDWGERITEVVAGNFSLDLTAREADHQRTLELAKAGVMPFSGRHLQHGDLGQGGKIGELFVNCTTAMFSFAKFWLLLKGSGVGRSYDGDLCRVNWDNMPNVRFVLEGPDPKTGEGGHPDYEEWVETLQEARHKYDSESEEVRWFVVTDDAEGWAKIVEILETAAWQRKHKEKLFIFDLTAIRKKGAPISGQQGRPASGPIPLIRALNKVASIKGSGMRPWKQAMFIDHYLSDCVSIGGIRRSARIAVKSWKDRDVIEFIDIKRGGWLQTANNSVSTDDEFWSKAKSPAPSHARRVFEAMCSAGYFDETGEPGALVVSRMAWNVDGMETITPSTMVRENKTKPLSLHPRTYEMMASVLEYAKRKKYPFIVNPCSEILLAVWGGYCVSGQTRILHRGGYDRIEDLVGQKVEVFNGEQWSEVTPFQTGEGQSLLRVSFQDGSYLDCTEYHKFMIRRDRLSPCFDEKEAKDLSPGDILPTFRVPSDITGEALVDAYAYGVYMGDRCTEDLSDIVLYGGGDVPYILGVDVASLDRQRLHDLKNPEHLPGWLFQLDRASLLSFLCGWLEAEGSYYYRESRGIYVSIVCDYQRAVDTQLLFRRAGLISVSLISEGDSWQLNIPQSEAGRLTGHYTSNEARVDRDKKVKQPRVKSVTKLPGSYRTFCFTEPKRNMGVFGNVLTRQCCIGDICLANAESLEEVLDAGRLMAQFLIRTNMMSFFYRAEVQRTNRIGVGLTGIHEFAWRHFGFTFWDLLDEEKSQPFWDFLENVRYATEEEARAYSEARGLTSPHTVTTCKPSGTVSKVLACTEGAHLPAYAYYMRWVQFASDAPEVMDHCHRGYPVKDISSMYSGRVVIGFPTALPIAALMGEHVVCAGDPIPDQHYDWLRLLEKYWLGPRGNNISYTLKYDPKRVRYEDYMKAILRNQPTVRACAVMPQADLSAYVYVPEEQISKEVYDTYMLNIQQFEIEAYGPEHLECSSGFCPTEPDRFLG